MLRRPKFLPLCLLLYLLQALPVAQAASTKKKNPTAQQAQAAAQPGPSSYGQHEAARQFVATLAAAEGWPEAELQALMSEARRVPAVQRLIMPPPAGTAKDWAAYRARFVEPRRLQAGLAFWAANEAALQRAEARFGVPAELVAGIIGVETFYGRITGGFRALDALATLSFDFPPGRRDRSEFFRAELTELIRLSREQGLDLRTLKASYAGALGWPQFMPSSWRKHALDFDGDGRVDLINSPADAIGSVAAFLAAHGWQPGMPTHYQVAAPVDSAERARLLLPDILPSFSAAEFAQAGAWLSEAGQIHPGPLALVELQMGAAAPVYIAGTANFYALTRYNWSSYYALAVIELGRELLRYRGASPAS